MCEYIRLLDEGKINIESITDKIYQIDNVNKAYEDLKTDLPKPLIVLLEYKSQTISETKLIKKNIKIPEGRINVGIIGAGGFTREAHLPNILKLDSLFNIYAVCDKIGSNADDVAEQYKASYSTTDFKEILKDDKVDMVVITTRHNLHAGIAIEAAKAGKAIFLEKPMALKIDELLLLKEALESSNVPFLVGYNRRFSPFAIKIKEILNKRTNAFILNYRINAGFIPKESWVHSEEGGGRNIGEACHIYDLFTYFTDSEVDSIGALGINPQNSQYIFNDNFSAVTKFKDGSVCNLIYTSLGNPQIPKEQMELYIGNKIIYLNDYKELYIYGSKNDISKNRIQDKGHLNELKIFGESIKSSNGYPIPLWQLLQSSEISFEVEKQLR
jgi:predicted dehydrogenase